MNTDFSSSPTNKDSTLLNTSSNLNMIQTATSHHEQYQSINDDLSLEGNYASSSVNNMISSIKLSKSVTNSMVDYNYINTWMKPEVNFEYIRSRTTYTRYQLLQLETEFQCNRYLTRSRRIKFAHSILLTERQVKIWFQSRRCRWQHDRRKSCNDPHVKLQANATNHHSFATLTNETS